MDIKEKLASMLDDKSDIIETPIEEILDEIELSENESKLPLYPLTDKECDDKIDDYFSEIYEEIDVSKDNDEEDILPIVPIDETVVIPIKNPVGRPVGIPANEFQKERVRQMAIEYQRKIRAGEIEAPEPVTHGAYTYMQNMKIGKKKRHFLKFVYNERKKWVDELGGEENLSAIELSMLDEAARLLMYSTLVNAHLMSGDKEIMFTDENGEVKMHAALSRNYLAFTRTYVSILKELQKLSSGRPKKGNRGKGDVASRLQNLYNK